MELGVEELATGQRGAYGPAWRWEWAQDLATCSSRRLLKYADTIVAQGSHYHRLCLKNQAGATRAARKYPWIVDALRLKENRDTSDKLKILTLGDVPIEMMAQRLHMDAENIKNWELLFFDVRAAREARDWIQIHVILPELRERRGDVAARLKLAFVTGPAGTLALLDSESPPLDAGNRLYDRWMKLDLMREQALQLGLDSDEARLKFLKFHTEMELAEQRLRHNGKRLDLRCQELAMKQKAMEARLEEKVRRAAREAERAEQQKTVREERSAAKAERKRLQVLQAGLERQRRYERLLQAKEIAIGSELAQLRWETVDSGHVEGVVGSNPVNDQERSQTPVQHHSEAVLDSPEESALEWETPTDPDLELVCPNAESADHLCHA